MKLFILTLLVYLITASAFVPQARVARSASPEVRAKKDFDLPDFSGALDSVDFGSITRNKDQILSNLNEGEFGSRGEAYVAAQFGLLLCIAIGGVPIVGDFLFVLLCPEAGFAGDIGDVAEDGGHFFLIVCQT